MSNFGTKMAKQTSFEISDNFIFLKSGMGKLLHMKFKTSDNKKAFHSNANCLLVDSVGYRVNKFEHVWGKGPCEVRSRLNNLDLSAGRVVPLW